MAVTLIVVAVCRRIAADERDTQSGVEHAAYALHQQSGAQDACMRDDGSHYSDLYRQDRTLTQNLMQVHEPNFYSLKNNRQLGNDDLSKLVMEGISANSTAFLEEEVTQRSRKGG